jgi:TRAP-type C4-dicarboxylate transport system permease small subunit
VVVSVLKIVAIVLILAGIAGLLVGKFTYTKATHEAQIGPLDLSVKEKKTVNVPLWAGVAAIVAGGLLLVVPRTGGPK